ncbi:NADPH-dependent FMN reductase [Actinokineospora sp. HUAS TT18]|uniref:NADPH-dependent FMN reductase n=1 Tax=Actinokineospora sp. HUAS TT18 TaxID=3447451 RepID=UPI003F526481
MERAEVRVLVFSASLRAGSLNTRLAGLAAKILRDNGAHVDVADMRDFAAPSYDGDLERAQGIPGQAAELRNRLEASDAFVIASPEYNASMSGVLKNAIDWTSRFRPQPWTGRNGLLMSASPSMVGGNRGLWALRVPLEHLGASIHPDMFSLAQAHNAFNDDGGLADETLAERLTGTLVAFLDIAEAGKHYFCARRAWVEFLGERADPLIDRVERVQAP